MFSNNSLQWSLSKFCSYEFLCTNCTLHPPCCNPSIPLQTYVICRYCLAIWTYGSRYTQFSICTGAHHSCSHHQCYLYSHGRKNGPWSSSFMEQGSLSKGISTLPVPTVNVG